MELFLLIAVTHFVALLSPGPDFFLILTSLLKKGKRAAEYVCVGIVFGNMTILILIFSILLMIGQFNHEVFKYLKWGGASYLCYLALQCFIYAKDSRKSFDMDKVNLSNEDISKLQNIVLGLQSSVLNPKNILFYSSLLLLIDQEYTLFEKALLGLWMISVVLCWNLFIVRLLSGQRLLHWLKRKSLILYYISGTFFTIFAILLFIP